jgi:hypothetical protein
MAIYGYLGCWQCRQQLFLGKWLREDDAGVAFWSSGMGASTDRDCVLGRYVLRFVAAHVNHDVRGYLDDSPLADEAADFAEPDDSLAIAARYDVTDSTQ